MAENTLTIEFKDSDPPKAPGAGSAASTPTTAHEPATASPARPASAGPGGLPITTAPIRTNNAAAVPVRLVPDGVQLGPATNGSGPNLPHTNRLEELQNKTDLSPEEKAEFDRIMAERVAAFDAMFGPGTAIPQLPPAGLDPAGDWFGSKLGLPKLDEQQLTEQQKRERDKKTEEWLRQREEEDAFDAGEAAMFKAEWAAQQKEKEQKHQQWLRDRDEEEAFEDAIVAKELAERKKEEQEIERRHQQWLRDRDEAEALDDAIAAKQKAEEEAAKKEKERKHQQWLKDRDAEDAFDDGARAKEKADKDAEQATSMAKMRTLGSAGQSAANGDYLSAGLQAASTGALGEELAMLAAGPEGALLAIAQTLYDSMQAVVAKPFEMARAGLEQAGNTGENIAQGDLGAITADAGEAVAGFAEKTGLAGIVVGEFIKTELAAVNALNQVTEAFLKRAQELKQYDGRIAESTAQADVRRLLADIREADTLGADLARLTKSSSDIEALQTELMLFLKGELLAALLEVVEPIGEIAKTLKPIFKEITDISGETKVLASLVKISPPVLILKFLNAMIKFAGRFVNLEDKPEANIIDDLIDLARRGMDNDTTSGVTIPYQRQEAWPQSPTWGRRNA